MIPVGCVPECPGCKYKNFSAQESDQKKISWAVQTLVPFSAQIVGPAIQSPSKRWGYRRKTLLHTAVVNGKWIYGLLKRSGWEFDLISIPNCPVHAPEVNQQLRTLFEKLSIDAPVRFVQVTGRMLSLVFKTKADPRWVESLTSQRKHLEGAGVESLFINWNPSAGARVFSSRHWQVIFGEEFASEGGVAFGPMSFRQQIEEMEDQVLVAAGNFFANLNPAMVVDLYSGVGAGMQKWEQRGWKTIGVELNGDAVRASRKNLKHSEILQGRAEDRIPQLNQLDLRKSVLFTNPARTGHHEKINNWINSVPKLQGIAYLSCNVKSLQKDLAQLTSTFTVESIQLFDFFPQTDHLEALVFLKRQIGTCES